MLRQRYQAQGKQCGEERLTLDNRTKHPDAWVKNKDSCKGPSLFVCVLVQMPGLGYGIQ